MRVRYVTTRSAVVYGTLRGVIHQRALRIYVLLLAAAVLGLGAAHDLHDGKGVGYVVFSIFAQLVLIGAVFTVGMTIVTVLNLYLAGGRGVLGPHELVLCDRGMWEITEYNETLHKWNALGVIRVYPKYYMIRTNETNSGYHVVPRRSHVLEGDVESFIGELRARIDSAERIEEVKSAR